MGHTTVVFRLVTSAATRFMNLREGGVPPPPIFLIKSGRTWKSALPGSWSQCVRISERRLSMNPPTPDPSQEGNYAHRLRFSPPGSGWGWVHGPDACAKRMEALHETRSHPFPLPRWPKAG